MGALAASGVLSARAHVWPLLFCCQRGPWLTVPLLWLHRGFTLLFGVSSRLLSVDMQNKARPVPSSVGAKGLECSPSTPTMNSYFYKFMINLLKRFSSERKLLEVRGAFIIRSVLGASLLPRPRIFILTSCNGSRQPWSLLLLQCVMVAERGKSRERRLRRRAWEAGKSRGEGNAGSSEGAGGGEEPAECGWELGVVAGKEMREQAQGPQPQRESGVEATLGVVKGLILRRGQKGKEQDGTVPASWEGPPRASW